MCDESNMHWLYCQDSHVLQAACWSTYCFAWGVIQTCTFFHIAERNSQVLLFHYCTHLWYRYALDSWKMGGKFLLTSTHQKQGYGVQSGVDLSLQISNQKNRLLERLATVVLTCTDKSWFRLVGHRANPCQKSLFFKVEKYTNSKTLFIQINRDQTLFGKLKS